MTLKEGEPTPLCRLIAIVALLSKSLGEEENADQLLNQVARSLMSIAKMPAAIEQAEVSGVE